MPNYYISLNIKNCIINFEMIRNITLILETLHIVIFRNVLKSYEILLLTKTCGGSENLRNIV